ncbi:phosphoribosylformylglycinamidine cyclo-ligase [Carboxydocella sp. ULO1]|nr:phosphoribosylformylglycinamidine cyclo-ligase [Carboxydocella sp. ULO1]
MPPGLGVELTAGSWPIPPIFDLIEKLGHIAKEEMARTFNLGIGMVAIVAAEEAPAIADRLTAAGEKVYTIGRVVAGAGVQVV